MTQELRDHDYVVVHDDGGFRIEQQIAGERRRLEAFTFEHNACERAKQLATASGSEAWLESPPGIFESLSD